MQKKFLVIVTLLMLVLGASLVTAQDDLSAVDPSGQTITYWHEWDGAQLEAVTEIINNFNTNNEWGITVETVELGSTGPMAEAMSAGITSGDLPQLVGGFANNAQSYFLEGVAVPLDAYIDDPTWGFTEDEKANLIPEVVNVNRIPGEPFNDQLLAWPIGFSTVINSVNLDMATAAGLAGAPTTLDEFRTLACFAAEQTGANGEDIQGFPIRASAQDMEAFIVSQGGRIWDPEAMQFDFTNEQALTVLTFFQQLAADGCGYVPETNFSNTADLAASLNPMAVGSSVGVPFILRDAAAATEAGGTGITNWTNTTTPWSEGNRTIITNFRSVIMIASTPEQQLATWLFIKHLASDESQSIWTTKTLYQPYTVSGLENLGDDFLTANPQFASVRDILLDSNVRKHISVQSLGYSDGLVPFTNLISALSTDPALDVAAAAAAAQDEANELFEENRIQ